jgi:proline iminopeptidase
VREPGPVVEPHAHGMLDVGDGQRVFWEESGAPDGVPAVVLHGGPGSGSSAGARRDFDASVYRIVQLDQRGCGRSLPHAAHASTDLSSNTTDHLVADIERLREHLGIERWLVRGVSWGVTLALRYAETHPARVTAMVLSSITLTRRSDVRWLTRDAGRFFPEEWRRFRAGAGPDADPDDLATAYDRLLDRHADPVVREQAARDWCDWEDALLSLDPGYPVPNPRFADAGDRLAFARLVTHYFSHAAFMDDGALLEDAGRLAGIPGVLVHGRLDLAGPPDVAWELAHAWPGAELHLVETGHTGGAAMTAVETDALRRLATAR